MLKGESQPLTLWRPLLPYHMGTVVKHPVPDRVKLSLVIFDIRALWCSDWASECPDVKNYKRRLNPDWHRMLYSCSHMATGGVKGLIIGSEVLSCQSCHVYIFKLTGLGFSWIWLGSFLKSLQVAAVLMFGVNFILHFVFLIQITGGQVNG